MDDLSAVDSMASASEEFLSEASENSPAEEAGVSYVKDVTAGNSPTEAAGVSEVLEEQAEIHGWVRNTPMYLSLLVLQSVSISTYIAGTVL